MKVDEDVVVAELGKFNFFMKLEGVEAGLAVNGPLFCG